jgi:hypothetical protein
VANKLYELKIWLVQILLVDIGTTLERNMDELCYLVDDPAYKIEHLATPASLFNVEPASSLESWPTHTITEFSKEVYKSDTLAEYVNGGHGVRVLSLLLN